MKTSPIHRRRVDSAMMLQLLAQGDRRERGDSTPGLLQFCSIV
ncbi:hypothetical protein ACFPRL_17255 [Pseudoclavibacter helvolus]